VHKLHCLPRNSRPWKKPLRKLHCLPRNSRLCRKPLRKLHCLSRHSRCRKFSTTALPCGRTRTRTCNRANGLMNETFAGSSIDKTDGKQEEIKKLH
jgi:hypothetical protein